MAILVTGGAGYIGSHTCVELLNAGEEIVVLDNFCNSKPRALEIVKELTGKDFKSYNADLLDRAAVEKVFEENKIDSVIHFAGLKAVGESVRKPIEYYHNNITGTLILCDVMRNQAKVPHMLSLIANSAISASESLKRRLPQSWDTVFTSARTTSL